MRHAATGESMPPDSRQATRPLDADRQPAGAAVLAEEIERLVGQRLDVDRQLGMRRGSPSSSRASLMRPPTSRSISGEVSGKRLSARRADTRNVAGRRVAEVAQDLRGDRVDVERRAAGPREVADAEDPRQPIAHLLPVRRRAEHELDPPHQDAHLLDVEVRVAARMLRTSRATNHGRFFPLSAISW